MLKQWIIFNKLENFNSILNYTIDDFTPSGNLSYMNQHGEILHHTPLREVFNQRCYIQHLMDESEDENQNPLSEENWMKLNNWKFIKYVIHHRHPMTPEQLIQKPFEEIFKNQHDKLIQMKGSQFKRRINPIHPQISQNKNQVYNALNETIHDEENSSEAEDESEEQNLNQMQTDENNGEQNKQEEKLLTTNFEIKDENRKVEGLITYSTDQQIFKLKINSGTDQEVW